MRKLRKGLSFFILLLLFVTYFSNTTIAKAYSHDCNNNGKENVKTVTLRGPYTVKVASATICTQVCYDLRDYCGDCGVTLNNYTYVSSTTGHSGSGMRFRSCNGTTLYYADFNKANTSKKNLLYINAVFNDC